MSIHDPHRKVWIIHLLIVVSLACATNTPVAQHATPRPTRTLLPTFTNTPLPPTATPVPTDTPLALIPDTPTPTPAPTDTPPPTDMPEATTTPVPTNTPLPPPTPVPAPPTNTPVPPTNTPEPVAVSPLATPTNTAAPGSPPGKYVARRTESNPNCAHVGVTGLVRDGDDDDDPRMPGVTIQVTGNEDGFRGPFYATTDNDGEFVVVIGEYRQVPERVEFIAEVFGPDVKNEDRPRWNFDDECQDEDALQIMRIEWGKVE